MGLIDFVKDVGECIFGKDKEEVLVVFIELFVVFDVCKGCVFEDMVIKFGFDVENFEIFVQGDVVMVKGLVDL